MCSYTPASNAPPSVLFASAAPCIPIQFVAGLHTGLVQQWFHWPENRNKINIKLYFMKLKISQLKLSLSGTKRTTRQ